MQGGWGEAARSVVTNETLPAIMKEGVSFIKEILLLNIHDVLFPADQCFCCLGSSAGLVKSFNQLQHHKKLALLQVKET